jgi:membrane-associated phospholipid phosphatase
VEKALRCIYNRKKLSLFLKIVSHSAVAVGILSYFYLIYLGYKESVWVLLKMLVFSALPFLLVSLARRLINAKRPYEIYGFYIEKLKDKSGRSFPSRHVFSSFLIATLAYAFSPIFALILCGVSIILAVCRVLLGIHFISDVVFGALIGIFSGALTVILIQ